MTAPTTASTSEASSSKHSLYEGSTQYRHWRYSPEQLAQARTTLNAAAVKAIRDAFETDELGSSSSVSFLNADEELLLVKLYVGKISQLCGHFRFPEEVEATAVTYLKRFYLKNTVMDWHPKNVMLTALFLATKTTNHPIALEAYTSHIPKTTPSDVLDLEFLVAQSLGFDFAVWHAHRALWGLYLDIQSLPDFSIEELRTAYEAALKHVRASRLSDAELVYTPSQIALACLALASPSLAYSWARSKYSDGHDPPVLMLLEPLKAMILTQGTPPEVEAVREVDRRLKLCKNPQKVVGSKAYLKKQEETVRKAEEKRKRKAAEVKKAMEDGDPFGCELADGGDLDDDDDDD
ncbi:Cyclin mcs2 [Sparassis crispa]|uniref:Cyclin mcs2 n=1 Tax=Sparassis crispa TaxID=139825 RepID=A0A401G850_9APHY|nr:Cyclin mcs2 [Sparassis crispa]GBE78327.1 Cyclin mcs2 [Sparassis crispa]